MNAFNLNMYVVGGGVSSAWEAFSPFIFEELRQRSLVYAATAPASLSGGEGASGHVDPEGSTKTIITRALLGSDAGLYGAAQLPHDWQLSDVTCSFQLHCPQECVILFRRADGDADGFGSAPLSPADAPRFLRACRRSANIPASCPISQYRKFPQVGVTAYPIPESARRSRCDCSVLFSTALRMWAESSSAARAPAWARLETQYIDR